jgi:hypothetical protein
MLHLRELNSYVSRVRPGAIWICNKHVREPIPHTENGSAQDVTFCRMLSRHAPALKLKSRVQRIYPLVADGEYRWRVRTVVLRHSNCLNGAIRNRITRNDTTYVAANSITPINFALCSIAGQNQTRYVYNGARNAD